jgi:two-component system, NtrC family, response regulator AtoC
MFTSPAVLVIDDDPTTGRLLSAALEQNCRVQVATSGEEGLQRFEEHRPDLVLLDVMLPAMSGIAVLRALKKLGALQPVIMMTAFAEVHTAVQAIKLGAADYLQKPLDPGLLLREVGRITSQTVRQENSAREKVIGESDAMRRAWKLVERFGPTDIPVLLQGETGTGKGLIAEALHRLSKRTQEAFVAVDCATIPEQLAESELFGYEDGAFTGAGRKRRGRVAFADRGTLFLDEIGTLSLATQSKLLTLFEQRQFLPLGARQAQPTRLDVRFACATNVPLHKAVDQGAFRADLFHRLNGVTIELPPLRERGGDIRLLAVQLVATYGRDQGKPNLVLSPEAVAMLEAYDWPGNVRELQRVLSVAVVLADREVLPEDLPAGVRNASPSPAKPAENTITEAARVQAVNQPAPDVPQAPLNLREIKEWAGREAQKRVIQELQSRTNISQQELARMLGVDPKTLRSRLKDIAAGH